MSDSLLLFKQEGQHIYDYANVYDPDTDGSDVAASGKVVPSVRSMVIDNRTSTWRVYLVKAVDPVTYKVTYTDFPYKTIDTSSIVLNYGNDYFALYYDTRTNPTRLTIDAKMILFGANVAQYRLVKDETVISVFYKQVESGVNEAVSMVPVSEVTNQYVEGVRRCGTCYTEATLADGDLVTLELYDSLGVLIGEVELVAKAATILNSLSASVNPITSFDASCNQVDGEDWYLYKGQEPENLSIYPSVTFASGASYIVPVDNSTCFIYGLEDVDNTKVGTRYPLLIKYFVSDRYVVDQSLGTTIGTKRVLYIQKNLKVVEKPVGSISKLTVLPMWNESSKSYNLAFFAYLTNRTEPSVVTDRIVVNGSGTTVMSFATYVETDSSVHSTLVSGSFDPKLFGTKQTFTVKFLASEIGGSKQYYTQDFSIVLYNPATLPTTGTGRAAWNIEDPSNTNEPYGIDTSDYNRPEIKWDATHNVHFFDSTNQFKSVNDFIATFFRLADPPFLTSETQAPTPTKFRIKDVDGNVLVSSVAVTGYARSFLINKANTSTPIAGEVATYADTSYDLPTIVVLEFLFNDEVLYGVPVIILNADNQYTGE